jgi:hypothetical protein
VAQPLQADDARFQEVDADQLQRRVRIRDRPVSGGTAVAPNDGCDTVLVSAEES